MELLLHVYNTMTDTFKDAALRFLSDDAVLSAALGTIDAQGNPQTAITYFYADEDLNVYFLTPVDTRKYENMIARPHVALAIGGGTTYTTVQIEGTATLLAKGSEEENAALAKLKNRLLEAEVTWPIYQVSEHDDDAIAVFKVTPSAAYYLNLETEGGLPVTTDGLQQVI